MNVNRLLAGAALGLALLAPLVGTGFRALDSDPARLGAVVLAEWMRDRRNVAIVDLRDEASYQEFHLPGASLGGPAPISMTVADTIVLYDAGDGTARRMRRAYGRTGATVLYLEDGIGEWLREIMNPVFPPDATPDERASFDRQAQLSRYFGGMPRTGTSADARGTRELLDHTRRRGCAF